jgi:hypothetical protein
MVNKGFAFQKLQKSTKKQMTGFFCIFTALKKSPIKNRRVRDTDIFIWKKGKFGLDFSIKIKDQRQKENFGQNLSIRIRDQCCHVL